MKKIKAVGTRADISGKVEIGKVFGGYFSDSTNAQSFLDLGIKPILDDLPKNIKYSDFGGGEGYLGKFVSDFLKKNGKKADTLIVDANSEYLKKAKKLGLKTKLANLQDVKLLNFDLITMRAVNHYNPLKEQIKILENAHNSLKKGGYLISQISTGNKANVNMRNLIKNKLLKLTGEGEPYEWVTTKKYIQILKSSGFKWIKPVGYAPPGKWALEEQWERYNSKKRAEVLAKGNLKEVEKIDKTKEKYMEYAKKLVKMEKFRNAGVEKKDNSYVVHYQYDIIMAKRI
jgi:SAM-dependent methyltransferase